MCIMRAHNMTYDAGNGWDFGGIVYTNTSYHLLHNDE